MHALHQTPILVKLLPGTVMLIGLAIAYIAYLANPGLAPATAKALRPLYLFLLNKWYFDELYNLLFVRPAVRIGRFFWKRGDEGTIDRFGPNGAAALIAGGNKLTARMQSGYVYTYALVMLIGLAGAATWMLMPR